MSKLMTEINQFSLIKDTANATTRVFLSNPTPVEEKNLGRLFAIIEIEGTQKVNNEIIELMIHDINQYYYRAESLEIEAAFENALQKTNRRLQELIGEVGEQWLPSLTALFGVQKYNELVFAHVGKTIALMTHGNSVIDILDTAKSKAQDISPVKIFSNIVTGEISKDSVIFFSTETILDYLSKEKIRRVLTEYPKEKSSAEFQALLEENTNTVNFGSLILHYQERIATMEPRAVASAATTTPLSASVENDLDSMDGLKEKQEHTAELLSSSVWPSMKKRLKEKIQQRQTQSGSPVARQYNDDILSGPGTPLSSQKNDWKKMVMRGAVVSKEMAQKSAEVATKQAKAAFEKLRSKPTGVKAIKQKTSPALESSDTKENVNKRVGRMQTRGMEKKVAQWITPVVRWIGSLTVIQKIFFALAIIVLVVFGQSVLQQDDSNTTAAQENQYASVIAEIDLKINKGKAAVLYNEDEAKQLLGEAQALLAQIPTDSETYQQRGAEIASVIANEINALNKITPLNDLTPVINFSSIAENIDVKKIVLLGGSVYGFDASNGSVYRGETENGNVSVAKEDQDSGAVVSATKLSPGTALLTKSNGILQIFNPTENSVETIELPEDGVSKEPVDVTVFGDRIYTLDPTNNEIYRYDSVSGGYSAASPWIVDDINVETGVSIAIDAEVYVLKQDGSLIKMGSGLKSDFALETVEPALTTAQKIFTDENSDFLYILDRAGQRVVVFDKEGKMVNQFTSTAWTDLKDMSIDEEEGKMYLLQGASVYAVDITGLTNRSEEE